MASKASGGASLQLDNFSDVLADIRAGKAVIVVDSAERENEGDLILATEKVTAEMVSFLMREARGLICVSIPAEVADRLRLPLQVLNNNSPFQTPFAINVDHRDVDGRGVTAEGRARTMRALIEPGSEPHHFVSPGHVFPLIANSAGVMVRPGHTEGAFDLARLAGLFPSGILCEVLNPDGTMARGDQLQAFASKHGLRVTSIQAIREYRAFHEIAVRQLSESDVETDYGTFHAVVFADDAAQKEHVAMIRGAISSMPMSYASLVRLHSECLTGDVFGSRRCDCGRQLDGAMKLITEEGAGLVLYLRQEGRGIGLANKVRAYALQDQGLDTVEANVHLGFGPDERDFAVGAHMLLAMGIRAIRLITNNPSKAAALSRYGISVVERIPMVVEADPYSEAYLKTKREKLGHLL
ncbi:MAG: 3,4-dihydroxy-2-butanone 4-phosphate synthase / cyclohydrolase [Pseudomonadota bacterium]